MLSLTSRDDLVMMFDGIKGALSDVSLLVKTVS